MVECTESRLAFTVVNRWGHPEVMHKQEIFCLLVHLSWRIKIDVQENATVGWHRKSTTAYPCEWLVRVRVYVREGARYVVMGATWHGRAHVLHVTRTPQVLLRVKRMFFGDNGGCHEGGVSIPAECTPPKANRVSEGWGHVNMMWR